MDFLILRRFGGAERDRTAGLLVANSESEFRRSETEEYQVTRRGSVHAGSVHIH